MPIPRSALALRAILQPVVLVRAVLARYRLGSFEFRLGMDAFRRPWYAYGVYQAADLARRLKQNAITVMEFGVAGGDGLVELEKVAAEVEKTLGVQIHVYGFDTGSGMPQESDYRDIGYVWRKGLYKMDVDRVKSRLTRAQLILGEVAETVPATLRNGFPAPIGFVSFDLDYYSSTVAALSIFDGPDQQYLPRIISYFDDVASGAQCYHSEDVGELLAIREFNERGERRDKLRRAYNLASSLPFQSAWADRMYIYHRFDHPLYNTYIGRS